MNAPYFVEIVSRHGDVQSRQRIDHLPITIGRAYDNDCIIDDPHIAAHHAIIEQHDGETLQLHDLGSFNGILHKRQREKTFSINGNMQFQLGHSYLRVRSIDFNVANEIEDDTSHHWEGWKPALIGMAILTVIIMLQNWMNAEDKIEPVTYFLGVSGWLIASTIFCAIWAFISRLFAGHAHFGRHLFTFAMGILLLKTVTSCSSLLAFAFSLEFLSLYQIHLQVAILSGLICWHIHIITPRKTRRLVTIACLLAVTSSTLILMLNYKFNNRFSSDLYMEEFYPPAFRISSDDSVDDFMKGAEKLKEVVDADRQKALLDDTSKNK